MTDDTEESRRLAVIEQVLMETLAQVRGERVDATKYAVETFQTALKDSGLSIPDLPRDIVELQQTLRGESDRGCALTGVAFLDYALSAMIAAHMVSDDAVAKELFRSSGPLGPFSVRIDLAYLMGLLGADARREMHLLRRIRNEFAHSPAALSFEEQAIANRCRELKFVVFDADLPARRRFIRALLGVLGTIHAQTTLATRPSVPQDVPVEDIKAHPLLAKVNELLDRRK